MSAPAGGAPDARAALAATGAPDATEARHGSLTLLTWGLAGPPEDTGPAVLLSRAPRRHEADLTASDVAALVRRRDLGGVLPPFAAAVADGRGGLAAATDPLGMRHLYWVQQAGWAAVSTSARVLARLAGSSLDHGALAVQSQLGWQLGTRTLFDGVSKVPEASVAQLSEGMVTMVPAVEGSHAASPTDGAGAASTSGGGDDPVRSAARVLRRFLSAYLDDHPDAVLQLTGGQDSRILLSAVPRGRRRSLHAMTLAVPGSEDARIAGHIADRHGMTHEVVTLDGLDQLTPEDAHERCVVASERLDGMADPVAFAALGYAEGQLDQGRRLSGLGGEVARGFYYTGRPRDVAVTRARTERLVAWRMFANESAAADALDPEFGTWARQRATDEVHRVLTETGRPWPAATDEMYLFQRMQRWAGVVDSAVAFDREVVNPMLDSRFVDIARRLPPASKYRSRFLARLQVELDGELAALPLDGRPPPRAFAEDTVSGRVRTGLSTGRKLAGKARQRLAGARRPPAGGEVVARLVVAHWRAQPETLAPLAGLGVVRPAWLDAVLSGTVDPPPGTVAFLLNLRTAARIAG